MQGQRKRGEGRGGGEREGKRKMKNMKGAWKGGRRWRWLNKDSKTDGRQELGINFQS